MSKFFFFFAFSIISDTFAQNPTGIRQVYIDPATNFISPSSGTVILELNNGAKSTICINSSNSTQDAIVACRSMNYTRNLNNSPLPAVAFIMTKKTALATTYFQSLRCTGNESSLQDCPGYSYSSTPTYRCQNNNQDLNVWCMYNYTFPMINSSSAGCINNTISTTKYGQNILSISCSGKDVFFCGSKNQYGPNEAKLFCRMLGRNDTLARIIQGVNVTGLSNMAIGGFNSLSCPPNANSLDQCNNSYPYQSDACMPSDSIGVTCTVPSVVLDPLPNIDCANKNLTLNWNRATNPNLKPEHVSVTYNNIICPSTYATMNNTMISLTVSFEVCNDGPKGDNTSIIYMYTVKRTYPTVENTIVTGDQVFNSSCYVTRRSFTSHGPISINPTSISGGTNESAVPIELKVFSDNQFRQEITQPLSVPIGQVVFVRVSLINPPSHIILVLLNCNLIAGTSIVPLIQNRCPVSQPNVQITRISQSVSSFSFPYVEPVGSTRARVVCDTSKCGINELGCLTAC